MPATPIKYCIDLSQGEREAREQVRAGKTERRVADRARMILWADAGIPVRESARRLGCAKQTDKNWRCWYLKRRQEGMSPLEALADRPRPGRPRSFSPSKRGAGQSHCL
jgi:hypothetical protein